MSTPAARPRNLQSVWARTLLQSFKQAGVRHICISPGSRSTPFVLAAAELESVELHSIIDERSAAFFALGLARLQHTPALLICTSGTAAAHYFPAIIEASESHIPLIVLSADRPKDLQHCRAPQTTDQTQLYGHHVRFFADLGQAQPTPRAFNALNRIAHTAVHFAIAADAGPVHLNAPASKPLELHSDESEAGQQIAEFGKAALDRQRTITNSTPTPDKQAISKLAQELQNAHRPAFVVGPVPPHYHAQIQAVHPLVRRGIPVFAEATSQLRFTRPDNPNYIALDFFGRWLDPNTGQDITPDYIVQLGDTPTSRAYLSWLETDTTLARTVLSDGPIRDCSSTASRILIGDLETSLQSLDRALSDFAPNREWQNTLSKLQTHYDTVLQEHCETWHEGAITRRFFDTLPSQTLVGLGNGLPVRHADQFVPGNAKQYVVYSQRGVSGIDGWIAQFTAASHLHQGVAALLLGDVAFSHDLSSLSLLRSIQTPCIFVIIDNNGGRIFDLLPIVDEPLPESTRQLFTTPPDLNIQGLAEAFHLPYTSCTSLQDFTGAMQHAIQYPGASIIHTKVASQAHQDSEHTLRKRLSFTC